ncbi:carbohydrate ABC transporter permease [Paenibacillus elgii]
MRQIRTKEVFITYTVLGVLSIMALFPYLWMLLGSLKGRLDLFSIPPKIVFSPTTANYTEAFVHKSFLQNLMNSVKLAVTSTGIAILIGVPGAYALSRSKARGDGLLLMMALLTRMVPPVVIAIPFYVLMVKLKLMNTMTGAVLAHSILTIPLMVWMMKSFFDTVPKEIEEAAAVDGCTNIAVFFRIVMPLVLGGLGASSILCIITSWNEYLLASVLTGKSTATLPVAIPGLISSTGTLWGEICAVGTVVSVPIAIFTLAVQRHLVKGMTMGAVK